MLQDSAELTDPMRAVLSQICSLLECDQVSESLCHTSIGLCIWHARTHSDSGSPPLPCALTVVTLTVGTHTMVTFTVVTFTVTTLTVGTHTMVTLTVVSLIVVTPTVVSLTVVTPTLHTHAVVGAQTLLEKACVRLTAKTNRGILDIGFNITRANSLIDAVARTLYNDMFESIIEQFSDRLRPSSADKDTFLGVLDIFGFEFIDSGDLIPGKVRLLLTA